MTAVERPLPQDADETREFQLGLHQRLYNWTMRSARQRLGLTQKELGARTGLSESAVSTYESFTSYPDPKRAKAIAEVLGVPSDTLFPPWLKEFRMTQATRALEDKHFSLEQALALPELRRALAPPSPEDDLIDALQMKELPGVLEKVLETLRPRESRVLRERFGLDSGRSKTQEEVGHEFGLTRQSISRIEARALRKLGRSPEILSYQP